MTEWRRLNITQQIADKIAQQFTQFLNDWHAAPEVYDDALDAQIHRWYADILTDKSRKVWPARGLPYFSPSAANADPRSLYEKMRGAKKDNEDRPAFQGRWTRLGTAIGDTIQRDILFAERHYARHYGENPAFSFVRNGRDEPMFEDFAKLNKIVEHAGKVFALYGTCDGILRVFVPELGRTIRVGLEIKSKQTTYSQTSEYSTRKGPKEDHVKQCICYSVMYGTDAEPVDFYIILYVNASKKSWAMTPDEFEKNPDIAAFGLHITDDMRAEVLDHFAGIVAAAEAGKPPKLDVEKWTFNNFKTACALSLSPDELAEIERHVSAIQRSGLPDWKKRGPAEALADIYRIRAEREIAKEAA